MVTHQLFYAAFTLLAMGLLGMAFAAADPEVTGSPGAYRALAAIGAAGLAALLWFGTWEPGAAPWWGRVLTSLLTVSLVLPELIRLGKAIDARLQPVMED